MRNFQDTSETRKQSFTSAFLIFMTVPSKAFSFLTMCFYKLCFETLKRSFTSAFSIFMTVPSKVS